MNETIFALVTKPINQNIAVIRISGPDSFVVANKLLKEEHQFLPNEVTYQRFYDAEQNFIDEGLFLTFVKPNSFTGEDVVEIQIHGSMFVVERLLSVLQKNTSARMAYPGEFTKQAFLNKKLDLTKATAINSLINSENKSLAEKSIFNLEGKQTTFINEVIKNLENLIARIQVVIDYPENTDMEEYSYNQIIDMVKENLAMIEKIITDSKTLQKIDKGINIAIVGKPNAGKSTLLNEIIGEERVIVSDIKGTTRDVIDVQMRINDVVVTFKDTAGLRNKTDDILEEIGIKKAFTIIDEVDLILWLQDINDFTTELPPYLQDKTDKLLKVISKSDLKDDALDYPSDFIEISAKNKKIFKLVAEIENFIKINLPINESFKNNYLTDKLQIEFFEQILVNLQSSLYFLENEYSQDFILFELENSLEILYKMLGKKVDPDYINNLFGGFCLGK